MNGRNALVVEGGAMRGIFAAGVLDSFLKAGFDPFDLYIGVSAGASNIAAYLGRMVRRNYRVFTEYSRRPEFINPARFFLRGGHFMDLDWLWDITIREIRLDIREIFSKKREFLIAATDARTGAVGFREPEPDTLEELLKASSSIPPFYRSFVRIDGAEVTDGGVADPIPVREAARRGGTRIMVLRSRPRSWVPKKSSETFIARLYLHSYPELIRAMEGRPAMFRESIAWMRNPPDGIRVLEVNPPEGFRVSRLTKDKAILDEGYEYGLEAGREAMNGWSALLDAACGA